MTRVKGHPDIWRQEILDHLEDFPRQYAALEHAMSVFGDGFDLASFKRAYESRTDMDIYNRAQAVERGVTRVQNYVADLAVAGAKLAGIDVISKGDENPAERAFAGLARAKVIDASLARRLKQAQRTRNRIEHSYVRVPAGDVHRSAELVHDAARKFIAPYRTWIAPHLEGDP